MQFEIYIYILDMCKYYTLLFVYIYITPENERRTAMPGKSWALESSPGQSSDQTGASLGYFGFHVFMLHRSEIMAGQPTPPDHVPPPEIAGLIKGLLTIGFP